MSVQQTRSGWFRAALVATLVSAVVLVPGRVRAQSTSNGAIAGEVRDTTGAVLPGVTVEAASPALIEKVRTVVTDGQGQYKILELRPGPYVVTFTLTGFATVKREGLVLNVGVTLPVNGEMRVGALEETVTVTGASPVVDVQNSRSQLVLSREQLDSLPQNKTIQGFVTVTVGATAVGGAVTQDVGGNKADSYAGISIHGIRFGDGSQNWNGMKFNFVYSGGTGGQRSVYVNQAAVQEVVLETSGFSAESDNGGVSMNAVSKDGGNRFSYYFSTADTGEKLQGQNLNDELRARGLIVTPPIRKVYDIGGGVGGPIRPDRLWFYAAQRWWGNQTYVPGIFYNATQGTPFYTPDTSRRGFEQSYNRDATIRLTWQVTSKQKLAGSESYQKNCLCQLGIAGGTSAPEATPAYWYTPVHLIQTQWTYPRTNRLLFEAGYLHLHSITDAQAQPESKVTDISINDLTRGFRYNASANISNGLGKNHNRGQRNGRASVAYVTGSHAFKAGMFFQIGQETYGSQLINQDMSYSFRLGIPASLTEYATPGHDENWFGWYAPFVQDQWTMKRLTLNLGLRYDHLRGWVPAQVRPAGRFVPHEISTGRIDDVPLLKDLSPRFGGAYDLFGNGKTAIKAFVGRYTGTETTGFSRGSNPVSSLAIVSSVDRTWNDFTFPTGDPRNGNFVPDCDLLNSGVNGECGALQNANFGTVQLANHFDPALTTGWGVRAYNWQMSTSVQQEIRGGMALNVGYYRTSYGNFSVTDNLLVKPVDYDQYCITGPTDAQLGTFSAQRFCGLYNLNPAKFGLVDNLITRMSNFGEQTEVYNGVDATLSARLGRGAFLSGGVATGRQVNGNCVVVDSPQQARDGYCKVTPPWSAVTQIKFAAVYPLPWWGIETAATFQNLPGIPYTASYVATNAEIASSLGRNLSGCPTLVGGTCTQTAIIELLPPNTMFEDRLTQVDVKFTKNFKIGRGRLRGSAEIYNIGNANTVLTEVTRYGPTWRRPSAILAARLFKFGAQFDF